MSISAIKPASLTWSHASFPLDFHLNDVQLPVSHHLPSSTFPHELEVDPDPGVALGVEPLPIFGQFFVEVEDFDPVELLDGVVVVDPDVELLLGVVVLVVAASATKAPPVTNPPVRAPMAIMLRRRSFI